jgi:hypothetical protein
MNYRSRGRGANRRVFPIHPSKKVDELVSSDGSYIVEASDHKIGDKICPMCGAHDLDIHSPRKDSEGETISWKGNCDRCGSKYTILND